MRAFHFSLFSITRALNSTNVFALGLASLAAYLKERDLSVSVKPLLLPLDRDDRRSLYAEAYKRPDLFSWIFPTGKAVEYPPGFLGAIKKASLLLGLWAQAIDKEKPSAIGLSVFDKTLFASLLFVKLIKERCPDIPVILGGPACNRSNARFLCAKGLADMVVVGEGEETLASLLMQIRAGKLGPTPGAFVRIGEDVVDGGRRALLDVNALPVPDFGDLLALKGMGTALPVAFNRGCNFACEFCNERKFWLKFRQMETERAADLLHALHARYGVSRFFLAQSLMNGDLSWLGQFAEVMRERNLPYHWGGNIRIHPKMDETYLRTLYAGGCRVCFFGIESGSDQVLKTMKKGIKAESCRQVLRNAAAIGFWVHTYWIFGFPGETEGDLLQSVDFLIENFDAISSFYIHKYNAALDADEVSAENMVEYVDRTSIHDSPISDFYLAHAKTLSLFIKMLNTNAAFQLSGDEGMVSGCFGIPASDDTPSRKKALFLLRLLKFYLEPPQNRAELATHITQDRLERLLRHGCEEPFDGIPGSLEPAEFFLRDIYALA